jgi:hypothetical protein
VSRTRGAPRIHGELLKLGFEVAQSTVAKYMAKRHRPPSQGWRTFLRNHAPDIAAMDFFVVPTVTSFCVPPESHPLTPKSWDVPKSEKDGVTGITFFSILLHESQRM